MLTSRSGSAGHSAPPPPQSIEAVRRRARHRLIGAVALVLVGVVGFPLLFDTQPRQIAVDIPIEIPSRNPAPAAKAGAAAPAPVAAAPAAPAPAAFPTPAAAAAPAPAAVTPPVPKGTSVATTDSLGAREEVVDNKPAAAPKPTDKPADKTPDKASAKPADKPAEKLADKTTDKGAEKVAEKGADKAATGNERIVVQVGAFAEVERAREARLKLERAGLKTYTHVADTPQGKRIRVRLGPFATKAEAEKAAARAKAVGLPAALLWL
ncbi:SPOR domain-containing protein [Hydrogenophaga sp.]|uniref:SPOR domain-containing protein n=1 Tax=Hydrogenophaga sp. TaxID=1904254 RepID=UPI0035B42DC9